jgi:hypothetical protein
VGWTHSQGARAGAGQAVSSTKKRPSGLPGRSNLKYCSQEAEEWICLLCRHALKGGHKSRVRRLTPLLLFPPRLELLHMERRRTAGVLSMHLGCKHAACLAFACTASGHPVRALACTNQSGGSPSGGCQALAKFVSAAGACGPGSARPSTLPLVLAAGFCACASTTVKAVAAELAAAGVDVEAR